MRQERVRRGSLGSTPCAQYPDYHILPWAISFGVHWEGYQFPIFVLVREYQIKGNVTLRLQILFPEGGKLGTIPGLRSVSFYVLEHSIDIRDCNIPCFTETWLSGYMVSESVQPLRFFVRRTDRNKHLSGKKKGGGVCFMTNDSWCNCTNIQELKSFCSLKS